MDAHEHLEACIWTKPDSYAGFSPDGDYVIATQNRDSDALARSNWTVLCRDLEAEAYDRGVKHFHTRPTVYHWRASHWAVGWIEYLCVRADAPDEMLTKAGEWVCALADYPIADESHFSDLEFDEACEYWAQMDVADRLNAIARSGSSTSRFAARRDELPSDECGALLSYLNRA